MLYCLNLNCNRPENDDGAKFCQKCGTTLLLANRFQIEKPLGKGGIGQVFLARDRQRMNEHCVVKRLLSEKASDPKVQELFEREAKQLFKLGIQAQIPNLIAYFSENNIFYLVQELIEGEDLAQELSRGLFDEGKIRQLLNELLPLLGMIHQQGVIHRDLKPPNIMRRSGDGRLVLIDFGVSRDLSAGLTSVGQFTKVGTPGYASMEQYPPLKSEPANPVPASDLFSLGATCFELMTGISPGHLAGMEGYRWVERWREHVQQPMSDELEGVLAGLLKMKVEERFQTADQVLGALNAQANLQKYQGNLAAYEAEFRKMVASQWPLSSYLLEQLGRMRSDWGLKPGDVERVEQPMRQSAEAEYQAKLLRIASERRKAQEKIAADRLRLDALQRVVDEQRRLQEQKTLVHLAAFEDLAAYLAAFEDLAAFEKDMVQIPGGTFLMGSPFSKARGGGGSARSERPQHKVTVSAFAMGKFEVTQAQYEAVMGNNPSYFQGANRPVERVSWNEAVEFCQKLSQQSGKDYRLPSEAEWEYACRAGTTTPFFFGESLAKNQANFDSDSTTDVGSFPANDFGLYDMHGNVWEWCLDHWHDNYQGAPTDGSAWTTGGDSNARILRGGSWFTYSEDCRSANRFRNGPGDRCLSLGFRLVLSLPRTS